MDADFKIAWQDQMIALSGIKLLPQGGIPAVKGVKRVFQGRPAQSSNLHNDEYMSRARAEQI